jgi:hypothetical protein
LQEVKDVIAAARPSNVVRAEVQEELSEFFAALRPQQAAVLHPAPAANNAAVVDPSEHKAGGLIQNATGDTFSMGEPARVHL